MGNFNCCQTKDNLKKENEFLMLRDKNSLLEPEPIHVETTTRVKGAVAEGISASVFEDGDEEQEPANDDHDQKPTRQGVDKTGPLMIIAKKFFPFMGLIRQMKPFFCNECRQLEKTFDLTILEKLTPVTMGSLTKTFAPFMQKYPDLFEKKPHQVLLPPIYTCKDKNEIYYGYWNICSKKISGFGVLISESRRVEGLWLENFLLKKGRIVSKEGEFYEGDILYNKRSGHGIYQTEKVKYEGEWLDDKMHGKGTETFLGDKSYYEGSFSDGLKNGRGKYVWQDGSWYIGNFVDDVRDGQGEYHWADGIIYTGHFKNNQMNGEGVLQNRSGVYKGEFKNNKKWGRGTFTWKTGQVYEGEWENGKQHGKGKLVNGEKIKEGIWNQGKFSGSK